MKINTHFKLGFAIVLLTLAHLQMEQGKDVRLLDPNMVAAIVIVVVGSVFFGKEKEEEERERSPFLEQNDDYDLTA